MRDQPFIPMDYDVFAGLNVDKRSITVTFTLHPGFPKSLRLPYSVEHLLNQVRKHFPDVSEMAAIKQRIKSLWLVVGIAVPPAPAGSQWSARVKQQLRALLCMGMVRFTLDPLLDSVAFSEQQVVKITKEIRRFCQHEPGAGCL
jgi:hypothetical protein